MGRDCNHESMRIYKSAIVEILRFPLIKLQYNDSSENDIPDLYAVISK